MENNELPDTSSNEDEGHNSNENQRPAAERSLMSRIRRLVSQSTFHDDELDNVFNNYPQNQNHEEEDNEDSSSDESERLFEEYVREEAAQSSQSQFDCELPIQHSYLGETENVRGGGTYFEAGKIYEIAVCSHHSLIFPGEILPMIMLADAFFSRMTEDEGLTFGLIFQADTHEEPVYGVTCTVYERGVDNNGHITVKSRANQRFIVVKNEDGELTTRRNQTFYAKVKILPEILLPDPITINLSYSLMRHVDNSSQTNKLHTFLAASSHWPKFVYDQFSVVKVSEKIERYLAMLNLETPQEPIYKSFWLARNVPLNQQDRLKIFKTNCVNKRLLMIGETLNYMCYFLCNRCQHKIAIYNDIFAMSKGNVNANYCNPAGYIHETLTVNKTLEGAVRMVDRPSTEFSWFPGYSWQIAVCNKCSSHIGWKFAAVNNKNLRPKTFFGLSSKSLVVRPETKYAENEEDENIESTEEDSD